MPPFTKRLKLQTTEREKTRAVDLDFRFLHETGAKTAISERLITKAVERIGFFALVFNCEVKFNLARRGSKCAEADGRQLLFSLGSTELRKWLLRNYTVAQFSREKGRVRIFSLRSSSAPVVITRTLKQNPFLKDCFQNKAPSSNYSDSHVII